MKIQTTKLTLRNNQTQTCCDWVLALLMQNSKPAIFQQPRLLTKMDSGQTLLWMRWTLLWRKPRPSMTCVHINPWHSFQTTTKPYHGLRVQSEIKVFPEPKSVHLHFKSINEHESWTLWTKLFPWSAVDFQTTENHYSLVSSKSVVKILTGLNLNVFLPQDQGHKFHP